MFLLSDSTKDVEICIFKNIFSNQNKQNKENSNEEEEEEEEEETISWVDYFKNQFCFSRPIDNSTSRVLY
jgi:hypothetical protein